MPYYAITISPFFSLFSLVCGSLPNFRIGWFCLGLTKLCSPAPTHTFWILFIVWLPISIKIKVPFLKQAWPCCVRHQLLLCYIAVETFCGNFFVTFCHILFILCVGTSQVVKVLFFLLVTTKLSFNNCITIIVCRGQCVGQMGRGESPTKTGTKSATG